VVGPGTHDPAQNAVFSSVKSELSIKVDGWVLNRRLLSGQYQVGVIAVLLERQNESLTQVATMGHCAIAAPAGLQAPGCAGIDELVSHGSWSVIIRFGRAPNKEWHERESRVPEPQSYTVSVWLDQALG